MSQEDCQVAPGTLEVVRTFLNTWWLPNDTRQPSNELASLAARQHFYATGFEVGAGDGEVAIMPDQGQQLRVDLRSILGTSDILVLSAWLARQPIAVTLACEAADPPALHYRPAGGQGCQLSA